LKKWHWRFASHRFSVGATRKILDCTGSEIDPLLVACDTFCAMKTMIALTACAVLAMVSCENMNGVDTSGGFDPLRTPGAQLGNENIGGPPRIRPGQFVVAAMNNTAFYNQRPGAEAEADQLLKRGTSMKVISTSGSFLRVELDSGEVGFVPSVMVEDPNAMPDEFNSAIDPDGPADLYPSNLDPEPFVPLPEGLPSDALPDVIEPELPEPEPEPAEQDAPEPDADPEEPATPDI